MKPSLPDESLLSAYLDDELSEQERALVEEQLKVNEHWKQLLEELRNIQNLVRELPTPILNRSLVDGPWTQPSLLNSAADTRGIDTPGLSRRSFPMSSLAMAASILLCVLGAFAWMRFADHEVKIARLDQTANPEEKSVEIRVDPADEAKRISDLSTAPMSSAVNAERLAEQPRELVELRMQADKAPGTAMVTATAESFESATIAEAPKPKLKSPTPLPATAAPVASSDRMGVALSATAEPQMAQKIAASAPSPEPIQTLIAVRAKPLENTPKSDKAIEALAKDDMSRDEQSGIKAPDDFLANSAGGLGGSLGMKDRKMQSVESPIQRRELRILRSDLQQVIEQLRELGWVVQGETLPVKQTLRSLDSVTQLSRSAITQREDTSPRPPTLTGVINEPTDWIRIVFEANP